MKKTITFLCLFIAIVGYAQSSKPVKVKLPKFWWIIEDKQYLHCKQVADTLYIAEKEGSSDNWFGYLQDLYERASIAEFKAALPAMNKRNELYFFGDENYKRFAAMTQEAYKNTDDKPIRLKQNGDLPITGVSYEQVVKYCEWLTYRYNAKDNDGFSRDSTIANGDYRKGKNRAFGKYLYQLKFRLPSVKEAQTYNEKGRLKCKYCIVPFKTGYNQKGCPMLNFKQDTLNNCCQGLPSKQRTSRLAELKKENRLGIYEVNEFFPNDFCLYNIQGNVAEMTATKGVAVGGSYAHPIEECQAESTNAYTQPEDWLGFRVYVDFILLKSEKK